jgi:hypothetical protein
MLRHSVIFSLIFAILAGPNPCCCTWNAILGSVMGREAPSESSAMDSAGVQAAAVTTAPVTAKPRSCCQAKLAARHSDANTAPSTKSASASPRSCCSKQKPTASQDARSADACTHKRSPESQWSQEDCGCSLAASTPPAIVSLRDASSETKLVLQGAIAILEPLPALSAGRMVSRDALWHPSLPVASRRALLQRWNC